MNWLRNFMVGRYGWDQLNMALFILSIVLAFTAQLTRLPVLVYISYIPFWIGIFRILSRNVEKRRMENYRFSMLMSPVYPWFNRTLNHIRNSRTRRYFKCPNCSTTVWVPRGKGKIIITCPKCKTEFRKRA